MIAIDIIISYLHIHSGNGSVLGISQYATSGIRIKKEKMVSEHL